ncbi:MAG: hypothetical protein AB7T27_08710 [Kiritimatiellia bacterium]
MTSSKPPSPVTPAKTWKHYDLLRNVKDALVCLPSYFKTDTNIEGISATDIFTLNSALGATIENQVVATLNQMRSVWDPNDKYTLYSFTRQSQTFPDVLLKRTSGNSSLRDEIILGIELKGWYLLAKEAEPSFRFQVTAKACAPQDLLVVVPWALNNVISGSPRVFTPYIESAQYAAEYRNYHWQKLREAKTDSGILSPPGVKPYPKKSDKISDKPKSDSGGNFGRFARTGIMDNYLAQELQELLCGIQANHWLKFFKIFQDQRDAESIAEALDVLRSRVESQLKTTPSDELVAILTIIENIKTLVK